MTVPKPEGADPPGPDAFPNTAPVEGATKASGGDQVQGLAKLRLSEDGPGNGSKGQLRHRGSRRGGGGGKGLGDAPGLPPAAYLGGPPMGYAFPSYGQQVVYASYYMPFKPGGVGEAGQQGLGQHPGLVPYAFPHSPYSPQLRPPMAGPLGPPHGALAAAGRRQPQLPPVGNGWGGVPLGSQASPPGAGFPGSPSLLRHPLSSPRSGPHSSTYRMGGGGSSSGGSSARSVGAARTVPLPPRRAANGDGSAVPHSPAQTDRPARTPLAGSSLSSSASSDGEGQAARSASATSSSIDVVAAAAAAEQQEGSAEGQASPEGAAPEARQPAGQQLQQPAQQQQKGGRGSGERQNCAFFLKTGTCAYGDRCKFEHPYDLAPHVEFNSLGLPLRPSEPDCSYYMKYKTCGFGHTCKFHHPELEAGELGAAAAADGPPTPFPMQYLQYGGAPFALTPYAAFSHGAPQFMGPHPHGAVFLPPGQQAFGPPTELPSAKPAPPAAAAAPVPIPIPSPASVAPPLEHAGSVGTPVSPPRPLMVFGRSKGQEGKE